MFDLINEQMIQVKGELRKKRLLEKQLSHDKNKRTELEDRIKNLENQLKEEQADVQKLEGMTLTHLLVNLLGKTEERLEKEEQEVVAVRLRLESSKSMKHDLVEAIKGLKKQLDEVKDSEERYQTLFIQKEKLLSESHSLEARELVELSEQEGDIHADLKELTQAVHAAVAVKEALSEAIQSLENARGWGSFDMLGGGMISTAIKHNHLDTAKDWVNRAQSKTQKLQRELLDLHDVHLNISFDISGLLTFADYFFDGIISDWMVQGKINDSLDQTTVQSNKLSELLHELKIQEENKENELKRIKAKRQHLIERA